MEYLDIHKKFKTMVESMLEDLIKELGLTSEKFAEVAEIGLHSNENRKIFE